MPHDAGPGTRGGLEVSLASAPHFPALDGLRGVAALLVVLHHAAPVLGLRTSVGWGGWVGVDLFFVLSGFLITAGLLRARDAPDRLRTFWARRAFRLFPAYFLFLGVAAALGALGVAGLAHLGRFDGWAWFVLYAANFLILLPPHEDLGGLDVAWSLAVEEQFYLVWPLVVFATDRAALVRVCLLLVATAPLLRAAFVWSEWPLAAYEFTLCHADALAAGALLAVLRERTDTRAASARWARRLLPVGLLVYAGYVVGQVRPVVWNPDGGALGAAVGGTALAFAGMGLVAACLEPPRWLATVLGWRPLAFVGTVSYGLYLWHRLLGLALAPITTAWPLPARLAAWAALTTVVVLAVWYGVERPLLRRAPTPAAPRSTAPAAAPGA